MLVKKLKNLYLKNFSARCHMREKATHNAIKGDSTKALVSITVRKGGEKRYGGETLEGTLKGRLR
ncbi:hypothetical protein ACOBQJ_02410 [Pelotomaculum propionicicum]|uniref:hypothetical protein n=1 Tax=Pelotomaculum propionicicum TaxID=258475 RepID=UPI003B7DCBD7